MDFVSFKEEMNIYLKALEIILTDEEMIKFYHYMNSLIEKNKVMNLTGIIEPEDIILKHFIDSLTISKYILDNEKVIDIGTGAGFPGIPLKIQKNDTDVVLLDSLNKRINFLNEVISENNLKKVKTIHGRAEDFGKDKLYREKFDIAVSRAVAPLNILLEYMLPFVRVGGKCICMKGNISEEELEEASNSLELLGGVLEENEKFCLPNTTINRTVLVIKKKKQTPMLYPRTAGIPSKKPL